MKSFVRVEKVFRLTKNFCIVNVRKMSQLHKPVSVKSDESGVPSADSKEVKNNPGPVYDLEISKDYKVNGWRGKIMWWAPNVHTIFPLVKHEVEEDQFFPFFTKAHFLFSNDELKLDWCNAIMIGFWNKHLIRRVVIQYFNRCKLNEKEGKFWSYVKVVFEPDDNRDFVTDLLRTDWGGIITENVTNQSMLLTYNNEEELFIGLYPTYMKEFINAIFQHVFDYFILHYEIYENQPLTEELLQNLEKETYLTMYCNKTVKERQQAIRDLAGDANLLKRYKFLSLFGKFSNFEKDMKDLNLGHVLL